MKLRIVLIIALLVLLCTPAADVLAQGCPQCKKALESSLKDGNSNVGRSLNNGILYLLALPYSIAAVFGVIFIRKNHLRKKQHA